MTMDSSLELSAPLEELMPLIRELLAEGKTVKFSPKGTSMLPMLRQGIDSVVLSPLPRQLRKYDLPLYQRANGQYVLHRIVKTGKAYTCIGDNQFALEAGLRQDQMIAVVSAFYRGNRKIGVKAVHYQLYCRLWHYSRPLRGMLRHALSLLRRILG